MLIEITSFKNRWSWENSRKSERNRVWYIHHLCPHCYRIINCRCGSLAHTRNYCRIINLYSQLRTCHSNHPGGDGWFYAGTKSRIVDFYFIIFCTTGRKQHHHTCHAKENA